MSRMLVLFFVAGVLSLSEAQYSDPNELALKIVNGYNEEFKRIGKTEITDIGNGLFANVTIGELDTAILIGDNQLVNRTVDDDGVNYEVSLEIGLKKMYSKTKLPLGTSWKASSRKGSANIQLSVSIHNDSSCTASLNSLTVHNFGQITINLKPENLVNRALERLLQKEYTKNAAVYIKIINKGISDVLNVFGTNPEFQNITCSVFKSLDD